MKTIQIRIDDYKDRENMVWALVNAGYTVSTKIERSPSKSWGHNHIVVFHVSDDEILEDGECGSTDGKK